MQLLLFTLLILFLFRAARDQFKIWHFQGADMPEELPIIQKTYDFIKWYVPILDRLPRNHKFLLRDRIIGGLYNFLESLICIRYNRRNRVERLEALNSELDVLRHQTRLLRDFELLRLERYEQASQHLNTIGTDLGAWLNQQRRLPRSSTS